LVIIVAALCIGVLANVVLDAIYKKSEAHKKRMSDQRWAAFGSFVMKFYEKYGKDLRETLVKANMKHTTEVYDMFDDSVKKAKAKMGLKEDDKIPEV